MPKILVVDDSAVDRTLVAGLLGRNQSLELETAENGARALEQMQARLPDLVITDLQMPELDGLGLVKAVRAHFPSVPVIMMTAFGSEALAVEALEAGAAHYVPKAQLADKLIDTVEQVLSRCRANRSFKQLAECLSLADFTLLLDNNAELVDPLVGAVQHLLELTELCDSTGRIRVGIALEEALLNAIFRGNLEIGAEDLQEDRVRLVQGDATSLAEKRRQQAPYRDRRALVHIVVTRDEARFTIRDEGPGFDVLPLAKADDPSAVVRTGGRGLVLIRTFMDEVSYSPSGNEITMIKRRARANGRAPAV